MLPHLAADGGVLQDASAALEGRPCVCVCEPCFAGFWQQRPGLARVVGVLTSSGQAPQSYCHHAGARRLSAFPSSA